MVQFMFKSYWSQPSTQSGVSKKLEDDFSRISLVSNISRRHEHSYTCKPSEEITQVPERLRSIQKEQKHSRRDSKQNHERIITFVKALLVEKEFG